MKLIEYNSTDGITYTGDITSPAKLDTGKRIVADGNGNFYRFSDTWKAQKWSNGVFVADSDYLDKGVYVGDYQAEWRLDDNSNNNIIRSIDDNYDGVATRNTEDMTAQGINLTKNTAIRFENTDYLDFGDILNAGSGSFSYVFNFSIESASASREYLISKRSTALGNGFSISVSTDLKLTASILSSTAFDQIVDSNPFTADTYYHGYFEVDRATDSMSLYLNNVLVATKSGLNVTGSITNTNPLLFGAKTTTEGHIEIGWMQKVRNYNRILTPTERGIIYNNTYNQPLPIMTEYNGTVYAVYEGKLVVVDTADMSFVTYNFGGVFPAEQYLSAYYRFENNGLDSFASNDLTQSGTITYVTGKNNLGARGNFGAGNKFTRAIPVTNLDKFSLSFWVESSVEDSSKTKVSLNVGGVSKIKSASRVLVTQDPSFIGARYTLNTPHHIVITYNKGGECKYYIDSVLEHTWTADSFDLTDMTIESNGGLSEQSAEAFTDELGIFDNHILTQTNVGDLYNSGTGVFYSAVSQDGTPIKIRTNGTNIVFNTATKLYVCGMDGTGLISTDLDDCFGFDNTYSVGLIVNTTLNIAKYTTALVKTETVTTLDTDHVLVASFTIETVHYMLVQSATDNNVKLVIFDSSDNSYTSTVLTDITYNTVVKYYKQYTNEGYLGFIHTSDGKFFKMALDTPSTVTGQRVSLSASDIVTTFTGSGSDEDIDTSGLHDNPTGD